MLLLRPRRGIVEASAEAIRRWHADEWATGIRFYEDRNRAWSTDGKTSRTISPSECERLFGFPVGWTNPCPEATDDRTHYKRRNAVGDGFTVPVISRILVSLCFALETNQAGAMAMWKDPNLAAPFHDDVLDDLLPETNAKVSKT